MKLKQFIFALVAMLSSFAFTANAQNVAKVGTTEYATIDEAIAAWTNGTTLTLLADVKLSGVIKLNSDEYHILDLGTYTMTAGVKKYSILGYTYEDKLDAIEIVNKGRASASYTLDIKADANNPGGITASGKTVVKTTGKSGVQDRPIIRFYGGVLNGSNVVSHSGSNGTNCPQFWFYGGEFNGTISANRAKFLFYGGTFNGSLSISVDSSADALVCGGKFKKLSNSYGSSLNTDKFTIGSAAGVYDRGIYVDKDGYYVITSAPITEVSAKYPAAKKESYNSNNYFYYSAAATYGMFYEVASMAGTGSNVTVWEGAKVADELKGNEALEYTPQLPTEVKTFEVEVADVVIENEVTTKVVFTVTPSNANGEKVANPASAITFRLPVPAAWAGKQVYVSHDGTRLDGTYTVQDGNYVEVTSASFSEFSVEPVPPVATIGGVEYSTLADAIAAAQDGDEIVIIADVELTETTEFPAGKTITLNLNNKKVSAADKNVVKNSGAALTIKNGTIERTGTVAGYAVNVVSGTLEVENVTIVGGLYTSGTSLVATNTNISQASASRHAIYAYNCAVTINSGTYHNDNAGNAAVFAYGSSVVTINNGTFSIDNGKQTFGWTSCLLDANAGGKYVINGGEFKGHFRVQANSAMEINGGTFENTHNEAYNIIGTAVVKGGTFTDAAAKAFATKYVSDDCTLGEEGKVVSVVAKIGETKYETLDAAVAAAKEGDKITLLNDAELLFASNPMYNNIYASEIDLNGKTMTIKEGDLRFSNTTIKNGNIVVEPKTYNGTAIFLMYSKNLTLESVKVTATGVVSTYLFDLEGTSNLNLLNGSEILVDNSTVIDIDIICLNNGATENNVVIDNSKVTVNNIDGRVFFGGNYTVKDAEINLTGISKAGFRINAGQTLAINGNSTVTVEGALRDGGIHLTDLTATYTKAETATVNATVNEPKVAKVGENTYRTLAQAVAAVEDGGTITLIANETFTKNNRYNNGGWWDGLGYSGDKSFTIDLANFTISQDGALNDYLMWFKNDGAKDNTITLKNGTLDAGTTAYCALATASSNAKKITVNLENIKLINNNSNGATLKIRGGAELNANAGTIITGKNSYVGIEAVGAKTVVNIYEGTKIYQNGKSSSWGCLAGASGNSTINVYGGEGTSAKGGFIAMTSGGTINISGGEWTANTDGTIANDNNGVLIAQSDKQYNAGAGNSVVNVTGGTFKGGYNCYGNKAGDAQINISGGNFNANPTQFVEEGYKADELNDGVYNVVATPIKVTYNDGSVEYFSNILDAVPYKTNYDKLEGATIKLLANVEGAGLRFMENDMVFDLNGYTYTITAGTGSQGTNTSGFQIRPEVTTSVLFKNGTIKVAEGAPVVWMFNCYATQFIVENVTVDCANMAWDNYGASCKVVVSRDGDDVQFLGTTEIENFDSTVAPSAYTVGGTMTIAETASVTGTITLSAGATLTAKEGLDVVTSEGNIVVYNNGTYQSVAPVAKSYDANSAEIGVYTDFESAIAAAVANANIARIEVVSDCELKSVANKDDYYYIGHNLVIAAPEGKNYTVKGCGFAICVKGEGTTLTIANNLTVEGLDVVANGFATSGDNMVIDGTVKALSLKQWTSNGTITVNGKVELGYGDGQFDMAYGNGAVVVNGNCNGEYTTAQFKAGYSGTRGNGGVLTLNNTYFEAGAWFNVAGSNTTINVNNSLLKVSGGDNPATLTLAASNTINLGLNSQVVAANISGAGVINVDATGFNGEAVTVIAGNLIGFTGTINVLNNEFIGYEATEAGLVIKEKTIAGEGTETNPYLINNVTDLKIFRAAVNAGNNYSGKFVKLTANIDLAGENWEPIGTEANNFKGTFIGDDYTISNLNIVETEAKEGKVHTGFFGFAKDATIKNIIFQNVNINIPCLDIDHSQGHIGAVAGSLEGTSTIENVTVKGDIKVESTPTANGASRVAVVVGGNTYGNVTMQNVHVNANEGSYLKANNNVGALAGQLQGEAVFENCSSNINVTGTKFFAGGLVGLTAGNSTFNNCKVTANVTITAGRSGRANDHYRVGGIAGGWADGKNKVCTLTNCSYTGTVSGTNADGSVTEALDYRGLVGRGYTLTNCAGSKVVIDDVEFVQVYDNVYGFYKVGDVYEIGSLASLKAFRDKVNAGENYQGKTVVLTVDIDLAGEEWEPIGYMGKNFVGTFDGGNFTISNLNVAKELTNAAANNGVGLFGRVDSPATIKNLTIENATVKGSLYVGAVVGYAYTGKAIENVTVKGNIAIDAYWYAGVIGGNGYMNLVNNCHVIGNDGSYIKGNNGSYIGGIWGFRGEGANNITNCTVTNLSIEGVDRVGGISGMAHYGNAIKDCAVENVTVAATDAEATTVGLIAGACQGTTSEPSVITGATVENAKVTIAGTEVEASLYGTNIYGAIPVTNFEAKVGAAYYESLADAVAAAQAGNEVVILKAGTYALKVKDGLTITGAVDGVEFANIGAFGCNGANVTFNNVTFTYAENSTYKGLQHAGNLVYNNCTFNGQVFLYGQSETFNNCTFNTTDSNNYNVWTYGAKEVAFNECTFNSAGKSVLIYAESATVTNNVTVTKSQFIASQAVEGKAAIEMDSSLSGAINLTIDGATTATGFGTGNVSGNSLWNNKKGNETLANNDITVTVGGETVLAPIFEAQIGETKFRKLTDAMAAAQAGDVVKVFAGTYAMPSMKAGITIVGEGEVLFEGTLTGTLENLTMKNIHIKGGNAQRWAYAKGNLVFENVTFEATSVYALHFDGITEGATLTYKDCTIIGWAAMSGSPASCVFDGCTFKGNGTYGLIRTYFDATIKDCTFDVANVNTTDNYQDGIHAVDGAIVTVDNCTNANGAMADIVNIHATSVVVLDGVEIRNVAKIGDNYYATLQDAINAAVEGATVIVLTDIALAETVTVPADKTITLDLNGKTIAGTDNGTASFGLITNKGNLTIVDGSEDKNGKITLTATTNRGWNAYSSVISNSCGTLVVENGTIEHLGGTDMAYGIDNLSGTYAAKCTINGGTIKSTYRAIRQFLNSTANDNILTVNGGTIEGANKSIWMQDPSKNANKGTLTVAADAVLKGDVYLFVTAGSTEWPVEVAIANAAFATGTVVTGNVPAQYAVANVNGVWSNVSAVAAIDGVGYATLAAAVEAAKAGDTITLLQDVKESVTISKNLSIDGAGNTITGMITTDGKSLKVTIKNVKFDGNNKTINYALRADDDLNLVVENCTASNYIYGFLYANKSNDKIVVKNVTVENCAEYGAYLVSFNSATFEDFVVKGATKYGVAIANAKARTVNFKNVSFKNAETPLSINEIGTGKVTFTFEGVNDMGKAEFYTSKYVVVVAEAQAGTKVCGSLQDAIAAAETGETVKLLNDFVMNTAAVTSQVDGYAVLVNVKDKAITIDLNGKKVTVNASADELAGAKGSMLMAVFHADPNSELILTDSSDDATGTVELIANDAKVYSFIVSENAGDKTKSGKIVVNGGNYIADKLSDSMIYADTDEVITVNGGNFHLDNTGTSTNGKPWIFNTLGANQIQVLVNGGTYNTNIGEQYYRDEFKLGNVLTIRDNKDGTWSVVTGVTLVDGEFTEYTNDKTQEVEYISYTRKSIPTTWTPFYVPFEVDVEQLADQGFEVAYINGVRRDDKNYDGELDEFVMEIIYIHSQEEDKVDGSSKTLKANYPYFIRSYGDQRIDLNIVLEDAMLYAATDATYDCTTMTEQFEFIGNLSKVTIKASDDTALRYVVSGGKWSKRTIDSELNPFRFSMELTSRNGSHPTIDAPAMMSIAVRGELREDGTTFIYDIEMDAQQTVDYIYDLQGRRVLEPEKGNLYIINGKKVIF